MCLESSTFRTSCSPHTLTKSKQGVSWTECRALMHRLTDFKQRVFANTSYSALAFISPNNSCLDCEQNSVSQPHTTITFCKRVEHLNFKLWTLNIIVLLPSQIEMSIFYCTLTGNYAFIERPFVLVYLVWTSNTNANLIIKVEPHYSMLKSTWNQHSSCLRFPELSFCSLKYPENMCWYFKLQYFTNVLFFYGAPMRTWWCKKKKKKSKMGRKISFEWFFICL